MYFISRLAVLIIPYLLYRTYYSVRTIPSIQNATLTVQTKGCYAWRFGFGSSNSPWTGQHKEQLRVIGMSWVRLLFEYLLCMKLG